MAKKMIDISKHQSTFNASTAKANGIDSVILRVAYSTTVDSRWETFSSAVKSSGMAYGAYGFMTAHYTTKATTLEQAIPIFTEQVNTWINLCKDKGFTALAIDQERESGYTMAFGMNDNTALLKVGVDLIRNAGLKPFIYASASWIQSYIDWRSIDCDFWVAYYASSSKDSDFIAYADGTLPSGTYGDIMREIKNANKLFAWQFGSTGGLGSKYGVGSTEIDRNWQYKSILTGEEGEIDIPTYKSDTLKIGPVSTGDRTTMQEYATELGVGYRDEGYYIIIGPMNEDQVETVASKALSLGLGCVDYIDFDFTTDSLKIGPVSTGDRTNMKSAAEAIGVKTTDEGDYLIVGPTTQENLETLYLTASKLGLGCSAYEKNFGTNGVRVGPVSTGDRTNMKEFATSLGVETKDDGNYIIIGPTSNDNLVDVYYYATELGLDCVGYQIEDVEDPDPPVYTSDTLKIGPVSTGDRNTLKEYAASINVDTRDDGDYLIVGPMTDEEKNLIVEKAVVELGLGCENYDDSTEDPDDQETTITKADFDALKNRVDVLESSISALSAQIDELNNKLLNEYVTSESMNEVINSFNGLIYNINNNYSALVSVVTNHENTFLKISEVCGGGG